ncbi:MAG: hypothetical protein IPN09_16815 [Bacteroidetes bacterium]|nr:hypothetical protein [Bacteroidota bacterium]
MEREITPCGRAYNPRFLFSYPNSMIAVMGSEQLAGVMQMVSRESAIKSGQTFDEAQAAQMKEFMKAEIENKATHFSPLDNCGTMEQLIHVIPEMFSVWYWR